MKFIIAFILLLPSLSHASNEQALINILDSKIGTKYQKTELTTSLETGVWSKDGNIYLSSIITDLIKFKNTDIELLKQFDSNLSNTEIILNNYNNIVVHIKHWARDSRHPLSG